MAETTETTGRPAPMTETGMAYGRVAGIETPASRVVQGTTMVRPDDLPGSFALLDAALAAGCTAFDTARHYGQGNEASVGRWIRERGIRDRVFLIGKGAHHRQADGRVIRRVTPEEIAVDLDRSLAEFGFDRIDLYLLHRDDPSVPVGPIVEALDGHRRAGKILAYGGSNWTHGRIAEANAYAAAHGLAPFAASSPNFSLADQVRAPWGETVTISGPGNAEARAWYAETRLPLFTWSSLAGGFFSGRLARAADGTVDNPDNVNLDAYGSPENWERLARARRLAAARGLTVPQVALAFVLCQPLDVYALVAPRTPDEVAANVAAVGVRLTPAELDWLDLRRDGDEPPAA
jgi:aryl-alcohol dehydrogenase-like predicted oxidoreductase